MQKRCLPILLCLILLFVALPSVSEETSFQDILTSCRWVNENSSTLTLNADGTGVYDNGMPIDGSWTLLGTEVTFSYQLYGARRFTLMIQEEEGNYTLISPEEIVFYPEERWNQMQAENTNHAYVLAWNEEIQLGYTEMKLTDFQSYRELRSPNGVGLLEKDTPGNKYLTAIGTISNKTGTSINWHALRMQLIVDGKYTYDGNVMFEYNGSLVMSLPAAASGRLYLYAAVPDEIAQSFREAVLLFGFNDLFKTNPQKPENADFCFSLTVDSDLAAQAKKEPPKEKTYFEESPSLPIPTSYADVKQSGHSSSKSNGKVTKIEYKYRLLYDSDDATAVFTQYIDGLNADGYKIEKTGSSYVVSNGNKKIATVSWDNTRMTVSVTPGNEKLTKKPEKPNGSMSFGFFSEPAEAKTPTISIGDTIKTSYLNMSLDKFGQTSQLLSYVTSRKPRNWRYYEPNSSSNQLFYVQGVFTNLTNREINISNTYAELTFDGKETYRCYVTSLYGDGRGFTTSVISKDKVNFYIYAEVPKSVLKKYKSCELQLGFTKDFDIRHSSNGHYLFDYCDDVYILKIK